MMLHADKQLAARLEIIEAKNQVEYAITHNRLHKASEADYKKIGSGYAVFAGVDSPLTQAFGLGFEAEVSEDEIAQLEDFYRERGAAVNVEVCHLSDMSLTRVLAKRGYEVVEYSHVLLKQLGEGDTSEITCDAEIREVAESEIDKFAEAVAKGFYEQHEPTESFIDIFKVFFQQSNCACFGAFKNDEPAGGGAVFITDGVAALGGTSTLPQFRNLGIHAGLIKRRINLAVARGCDLAMVTTLPGTVSQRNLEKRGFQIAYARTKFSKTL